MSPELRARITARNETAAGFAAVRRDASSTADVVAASADRAASAINRQNVALAGAASASRMAAFQQRNLAFQLNDVAVSLASGMNPLMVAMQQGSQIATIYGPGEGGLGRALQETGKMAAGAASKFAGLGVAAAAAGIMFVGWNREINRGQDQVVSFGDMAVASFQLATEAAERFIEPFKSFGDDFMAELDKTVATTNREINGIVGAFVFAYDAAIIYWNRLPGALGDLTFQTAQAVSDGVVFMIRETQAALNGLITDANGFFGTSFGTMELMDYAKLGNPFAGAAAGQTDALGGAASSAFGRDYMGEALAAIGDRAGDVARTREEAEGLAEALGKVGGAAKGAGNDIAASMKSAEDLALGAVSSITGGLSALFEDNKAFAVANAVVNTAQAITKTWAEYGGGPWALPAVLGVAASGAAQIATILSASKGSSTVPSVSGGSAGEGGAPAASGRQVSAQFIINGGPAGLEGMIGGIVDGLAELINTDGATKLVTSIKRATA